MRIRLQQEHRTRELALLNLGLDSKLRACDLVSLKVRDITHGEHVAPRAIDPILDRFARRGSDLELHRPTGLVLLNGSPHICTRQYARMLRRRRVGDFGAHRDLRVAGSL